MAVSSLRPVRWSPTQGWALLNWGSLVPVALDGVGPGVAGHAFAWRPLEPVQYAECYSNDSCITLFSGG